MENKKKHFQWEWLVFGIFLLAYIVVTVFHEPWFDEAEAWQIAKCASLKEILFVNPHYEGHPPLWHLILRIPICLGIPYEIGLKVITGIFSSISVWLIIFKAPFSKYVRYMLPFGYFIFYQFGVISRPYCMMVLAFLLIAISFKKRNEKPIFFILSMAFLCLTSAYGILLAGGIAIAWVIEIICDKSWASFSDFWKDRRVYELIVLFFFALWLIYCIVPSENTRAIFEKGNTIGFDITSVLYTFFVMIPDCFLTSINQGYFGELSVSIPVVISCAIMELFILFIVLYQIKTKKIKFFLIPLFIFAIFFAFVYNNVHHIGAIVCLFIFALWISFEEKQERIFGEYLKDKFKFFEKNEDKIKQFVKMGTFVCLAIPVFWTCVASINEINYKYCFSRDTAQFFKETKLYEAKIAGEYSDNLLEGDLLCNYAVEILPYFDDNIVMNLGNGENNKAYIDHIIVSQDVVNETILKLQKKGAPDVLLGSNCLANIYEDVSLRDYVPIYCMESVGPAIWKATLFSIEDGNYDYVFLRKDLLKKYNLKEIPMLY